jgi:uncharacterized SAM-binding protein YcdF (DUF218 family)
MLCSRAKRGRQALAIATDIVGRLTHPAVQALLLAILATVLVLWRRPRAAALSATLALVWIWIASTPALALSLREGLATASAASPPHADAIVVLGGGKLPVTDWSRTTTRAGRGLTLWRDGFAPVGFALAGVPGGDLRIESSSVNTHENARNSTVILKASGLSDILLVTSAIHMRRAAACFRHEGIAVTPVPADDGHARLAEAPAWLPRRDALTLTARCLREYLALRVYRWRGWI